VFVLGRLFQPTLVFAGKARSYLSEAHFMCSIVEYALGHPQTLEKAGKSHQ